MSIEIIFYPQAATKEQLRNHLLSLGYLKCKHLWKWSKGALHFVWYNWDDYKSIDGVEATIYPADDDAKKYECSDWLLHTRTRASASSYDREYQNETIRTFRQAFGGKFHNDWHGHNRYTPVIHDSRQAIGRGICCSYMEVKNALSSIQIALPKPLINTPDDELSKIIKRNDPTRILYNALVPFTIAALESFFSQTFKIMLKFDDTAKKKLEKQSRKIEMTDVIALANGEKSLEDIIAGWYSFQNIQSITAAYKDWFDIDIKNLLWQQTKLNRRTVILEKHFNDLIEFRHGIIHRFEFNYDLTREQFIEMLNTTILLVETFVNYLETERGLLIKE